MNHYLIFSAINDYFKDISTLDSGRIFSAFVSDDGISRMIRDEIIVHCIPEYYDKNKRDTKKCDIQEVLDEAKRRGYHATKDSGLMRIAASIEADVCLKDYILRSLSLLGADFDISLNSEARYFSSLPSATSSEARFSYWGLPALAVYFQDQGLEPEDILTEIRISCSRAEVKSNPYLKDPETFLKRCAPYRKPARRTAWWSTLRRKVSSKS